MKNIRVKKSSDDETILVEKERLVNIAERKGAGQRIRAADNNLLAEPRSGYGELGGKAIYLSECYDWILGRDDEGCIVVVPLKRK